MFEKIGQFVARRWWLVVLIWVAIAALLRITAPPWDSVTYDGDLAYLPTRSPSVQGEALLARAFPQQHGKSQLVVVVSRSDVQLTAEDIYVTAYDVARRLKLLQGAATLARSRLWFAEADELSAKGRGEDAAAVRQRAEVALEEAERGLDEAAYFDQELLTFLRRNPQVSTSQPVKALAAIYWNRAQLLERIGESRAADADRRRALIIDPRCEQFPEQLLPEGADQLPILDVWTWREDLFGKKLVSQNLHARLIVVQVANEFLALGNQTLLRTIDEHLQTVRDTMSAEQRRDVSVHISGSTAVGGDMLLSAKESIENTELFTILLIVIILVAVYRAPLLVIIPLISIGVSLLASTNLVAWMAWLGDQPALAGWWQFKVFTTTKIFIVVILFGAGTDYCLFLIARYREELSHGHAPVDATPRALAGVGDALTASAFTTIIGLAMMFFSEFGKFRYSGPVIGLCLAIALMVCMTLTPALLRACGRWVFWPYVLRDDAETSITPHGWSHGLWSRMAQWVCRRPGLILLASVLAMLPLASVGVNSANHVTYDILSALDESRPSRLGADELRKHFPIGESGPLTIVLLRRGADFRTEQDKAAINDLSARLYGINGVTVVRSIIDPLGEFPPEHGIGIAMRTYFTRPHRKVEAMFVAQTQEYRGDLIRIDVILEFDPFSREAMETLRRVDAMLRQIADDKDSFWHNSEFVYAGPTAAVRDLHDVTLKDRHRIEILVLLAVYLVLVAVLRRPAICVYLILSVLFSYFVTIGVTELFFAYAYGDSFQGLDWKVPLFLFVILVAIGQDYNVYLATRVFEEQQRRGPFEGLRYALIRTGGIITSCGVIMAGTFIAMTTVAWADLLPESWTLPRQWLGTGGGLRSMVELGFALALGVLIDTFIVRPVLVPAFLALLSRRAAARAS